MSVIEKIYSEIDKVLGPSVDTQMFSMVFPATIINPDDFKYDTNDEKPPSVALNESRLVNKVIPMGHLVQESGSKISGVYRRALESRIPRLDPSLIPVRAELRNLLNTVISKPYRLPDGNIVEGVTLGNLYETMVGFYTTEIKNFDEEITKVREQIAKEVKNDSQIPENKKKKVIKDKFIVWYTTNGRGWMDKISSRRDAVLSVLSPDEMSSFRAVLSAGNAGVFEDAKLAMEEVERSVPGGGRYYPVQFTPSNWASLLTSGFSEGSALQSPEFLSGKLKNLKAKLRREQMHLNSLLYGTATAEDLTASVKALKDAEDGLATAQEEYQGKLYDGVEQAVTVYMDYRSGGEFSKGGAKTDEYDDEDAKKVDSINKKGKPRASKSSNSRFSRRGRSSGSKSLGGKKSGLDAAITKESLNKMVNLSKEVAAAGAKMTRAQKDLTEALRSKTETQARMRNVEPFIQSVNNLQAEILEVEAEYQAAINSTQDKVYDITADGVELYESELQPVIGDDSNWTTLTVTAASQKFDASSQSQSQADSFSCSVSLGFFGSAHYSSSSSSASSQSALSDDRMSLEMTFKVAKVGIDRPWMDLSVFNQSKEDWNNLSDLKISNGSDEMVSVKMGSKRKFDPAILPSIPVAMILAKDVAINMKMSSEKKSSFKSAAQSNTSYGGGCFCFSCSGSSSRSSERESTSINTTENGVTINIKAPQVIGYILDCVPKDTAETMQSEDYSDLITFMKKYEEILSGDMEKKFNR